METETPEAKSYSAERTFPHDYTDPKDVGKALFNVACIVAHRIRRDGFRASSVSVFVKRKDFSVTQKQSSMPQATHVTAVILNEARRLLDEIWDGSSPIRQIGLGVSKLTHENAEQMSLFEDPKMEYYRNWDRQYDEQRSRTENAVPVFTYESGEQALAAAKKAIKGHPACRFHRTTLPDGTDCFEVTADQKVIERHVVTAHGRQQTQ